MDVTLTPRDDLSRIRTTLRLETLTVKLLCLIGPIRNTLTRYASMCSYIPVLNNSQLTDVSYLLHHTRHCSIVHIVLKTESEKRASSATQIKRVATDNKYTAPQISQAGQLSP
eukprot:6205051-Pleurochrysis_carterae.AAC.2